MRLEIDRRRLSASTVASVASWLLLVVLTVAAVGSSLVGRTTFLATDIPANFAPWKVTLETLEPPQNPMLGDTVDTVVPQSALILDAARDGYLAEWNPYTAGGSELGGLPNSGVYSPLSLPWWILPHEIAPGFVKLLEIVTIAVGMSLFLRRLKLPNASWALASIVYVSSGFMVAWTNWPQTRVAALIPLLFWALDRASVRRSWWGAIPVGLVVAGMLLGGFPAVTGYALYAGAAYVLVRAAAAGDGFRSVVVAGVRSLAGVVLGLLLAAWMIVPFAYNALTVVDLSVREQDPSRHLAWEALATAFAPELLGSVDGSRPWLASNSIEAFSYLGVAAVVLVAATFVVRPRQPVVRVVATFSAVALAVCVVLTYAGGPLLALAQELPVMSNNFVGRLRVMVGFFGAVLAAFGLAAISDPVPLAAEIDEVRAGRRQLLTRVFGVLVAGFIGLGSIFVVRRTQLNVPDVAAVAGYVRTAFVIGMLAALFVLVAWLVARRWVSVLATVALVSLVAVPAVGVVRSWWPQNSVETFYPMTATHQFLDSHLEGQRYVPVGQTMLPGTSSYYEERSFAGHTFMTPEWKEAILAVDPDSMLSPTYSVLTGARFEEWAHNPLLDRLAVRYVVAEPGGEVAGRVEPADEALSSVVVSPGESIRTGGGAGPLRGILLRFQTPFDPGPEGSDLTVSVLDEGGSPLAETNTWVEHRMNALWVTIDADGLPADATWSIEVEIGAEGAPAHLGTSGDGTLLVDVVRPSDDGLSVVHTGDSTIYERANALQRVRWAPSEVLSETIDARLAVMADPETPPGAVVLEDPEDVRGLDGTSSAVVEELETDLNHVTVAVDADGPGWVVVADSLRREGWTAAVDDVPVPLVAAEHVGGAVFVEGGTHTVELTYRTPGLQAGVVVTLVTIGGLIVTSVYTVGRWILFRRRSRQSESLEVHPSETPER